VARMRIGGACANAGTASATRNGSKRYFFIETIQFMLNIKSKVFFFEKKNQKTFIHWLRRSWIKVFCYFFSKK